MAYRSHTVPEADILAEIVAPDQPDIPPEFARSLLELRFRERALDRMNDLAEKSRQGTLTEAGVGIIARVPDTRVTVEALLPDKRGPTL